MCANKLPYLTGYYAKTSSYDYVLDIDFSPENRAAFKQHVLKYKPNATFQEIQVADAEYQEGKRVYVRNDTFSGSAGYAFFAGESAIDISSRTIIYSSSVAICANILSVMIHEDGHCDGLAHECCNQRWVQFQGTWRKTQDYKFGNINAGGFMSYGGKGFTPVDDWDLRRINGIPLAKGRIKGTITINGEPLKGANLIFISQTKTYKPAWRVLRQRFSTIVDILGDGDGSFEIELPPGRYRVMLVPIGDYSRKTHGVWRIEESQIADIEKPLFLNARRTKLLIDPATKANMQVTNGMDSTFNWVVDL